MGVRLDMRWLHGRVTQLQQALYELLEAFKVRDNLALSEAADELVRGARAVARATQQRDLFDD